MEKISLEEVLNATFDQQNTEIVNHIVYGTGTINTSTFHILGTSEDTEFGVDEALEMASKVLKIIKTNDHAPIILLVDVIGQKLSMRDEWLGMYAYFAHLLECLHVARKQGFPLISLIYNQAIGGSFIAFGMMADRIYALSHAQLAVMWLEGMSKVTKIDLPILQEISKTSPVFAPGVENFKKLGGLHDVLRLDEVKGRIIKTLQEPNLTEDNRSLLGQQLGGRPNAYAVRKHIEQL